MTEVQSLSIDQARQYYERFFEVYPTAGRYWKFYAEHEFKAGNFKKTENIFRKCLRNCLNVELWKAYLSYIETKVNINANTAKDDVNQADLEEVIKAYNYAIDHVGKDVASTDIWRDLIKYIKLKKVSDIR